MTDLLLFITRPTYLSIRADFVYCIASLSVAVVNSHSVKSNWYFFIDV